MRPNINDQPPLPYRISAQPSGKGLDAASASVHRLIDSLLRHGEGTDLDLDALALRVDTLSDELDAHAPDFEDRFVEMWATEQTHHDPVTGVQNPIAPPLAFTGFEDGRVEAEVTLGLAYQGQPKMAHGGISSLMLDHAFGVANGWAGLSGMTVHLEVDYRAPVPLLTPLVIRARQVRVEGRKIWTEGCVLAGDKVCVEASALFIAGHLPRPGNGPTPR